MSACRVCARVATVNLDEATVSGLWVCDLHEEALISSAEAAAREPKAKRALGFGVLVGSRDGDNLAPLKCDKCRAEWSSINSGTLCPWCLSSFAWLLNEERAKCFESLTCEPSDSRYEQEIARRSDRLSSAVRSGVITKDDALSLFDEWAEASREAEAHYV